MSKSSTKAIIMSTDRMKNEIFSFISNIILGYSRNTPSSNLYKDVLELILLCTINEEPSTSSSSNVYLPEIASSHPEKWDKSRLDQALFERLRMSNPSSQLIGTTTKKSSIRNDIITENHCLYYLSECYQRLLKQRVNSLFIFVQ
jgi:hypothetical protein